MQAWPEGLCALHMYHAKCLVQRNEIGLSIEWQDLWNLVLTVHRTSLTMWQLCISESIAAGATADEIRSLYRRGIQCVQAVSHENALGLAQAWVVFEREYSIELQSWIEAERCYKKRLLDAAAPATLKHEHKHENKEDQVILRKRKLDQRDDTHGKYMRQERQEKFKKLRALDTISYTVFVCDLDKKTTREDLEKLFGDVRIHSRRKSKETDDLSFHHDFIVCFHDSIEMGTHPSLCMHIIMYYVRFLR
jgi:hypothetical protein